jgi:hypothetical protein
MTEATPLIATLDAAVRSILDRTKLRPQIGLVLGSGLGAFAETLERATAIPYGEIPGFPTSTAIGHKGELVIGESHGVPVAVMAGRVHFYEGYTLSQVVFPVRVLGRMGVKILVLTNAAGSVNVNYRPGELMVLEDHINLMGSNPLIGPNHDALGQRFPDLSEAYDPKLQRTVALKTLRLLDAPRAPEQVSGLLREAVTVARFSHPHIVAVHDVEDTPEAAFIAMEYVDGSSLDRILSGGQSLPSSQIAALGLAVARALEAAHGQGIVHRDVKPANVLLGRDGSIKVTDFGIADLVSSIGRAGTVFGTPGYIAPESLRGEGQGAPGDLFALGVILYFCATGTHPFTAPSTAQVLRATLAHSARPPRALQAGLHPELELLIVGLLGRSPAERRPGSARELAERLEALCAREGWRWQVPALAVAHPPADSAASHSVLLESTTNRGWTTRGTAHEPRVVTPHKEMP